MQSFAVNSVFRKANELKENLNQVLDNFLDVAQYWIEMENSNQDLIILKVSIKTDLQRTLDQISGDISGLVTYELEIEDAVLPISTFQQRPNYQRIYDDIDNLESLFSRPFIKEVVVEGEEKYKEIKTMSDAQVKLESQKDTADYEQERIFNLTRVIKIKVISEIN